MKRLLLTLLILSVAFTACDDKPEPEIVVPSEIKIDVTSIVFLAEGGSEVVKFNSSHDWTTEVKSEQTPAWCTVTPKTGKSGDASFTVTASPSETPSDKSATITISAGTVNKVINVTQKQKDALTVTASKFEVESEGGEVSVEVKANIDFSYEISDSAKTWISYVETKAIKTSHLIFAVQPNEGGDPREGVITIKSGDLKEEIKVVQKENPKFILNQQKAKEREILMTIYEKMGGEGWTNSTNWGSDLPVSEWFGINVNIDGLVTSISLTENNLTGEIPTGLYEISNLKQLNFYYNNISGEVPADLGKIKDLELLYLGHNEFTGPIPSELGDLVLLEYLSLDMNKFTGEIPPSLGNLKELIRMQLFNNELTGSIPPSLGNLSKLQTLHLYGNFLEGSIPAELGNLTNLKDFTLWGNKLSGKIPESIMKLPCWDECWHLLMFQQDFGISYEGIDIHIPEFSVKTLTGETLTNDIVKGNKLTLLYHFTDWCPFAETFTPRVVALYEMFKDQGLAVFSPTDQDDDVSAAYVEKHRIPWPCTVNQNETGTFVNYIDRTPVVAVFDSDGKMVFSSALTDYGELFDFLTDQLGSVTGMDPDYNSTDFSKDGEVVELQKASEGNGIDLILMGDGYTDRLIADGTYGNVMKSAMEHFFASEPVKTYRNLFNVYAVTAVSKNEVYTSESSTAIDGYFGTEMHVGGDNAKAMEYARKAIGAERMNDAVIVVIMNSPAFAGTCYMYDPENNYQTDYYGNGTSVSYFPVGINEEAVAQLIKHEAVGHGFAKLADEYAYKTNGAVNETVIAQTQSYQMYGWRKNVDFTNDPAEIKWSAFLSDPRYEGQDIGIYEGALTYYTGVYRPSKDGAMNSGVGPFNAPSREAIYYRIHKLAYGESWEYDYEEFVEYDAINRTATASPTYVLKPAELPGPPVVTGRTWREDVK